MPYIKSICRAGRTMEIEKYYTYKCGPSEVRRGKKVNKTSKTQQEINDRQAVKKLTRILNANFDETSWYVTFSYAKDKRPDVDTMKKHIRKLLSDMRKVYKQNGKELKYVETAEVGKNGAKHFHIVINNIDIREITKLWEYGYVNAKPLDDTGQYRKLAEYFMKYYKKTRGTAEQLQKKAYNCSRNLERPEPQKRKICSRRFRTDIRIPDGWYLDEETKRHGETADGYEYFSYTLIRCKRYRKKCDDKRINQSCDVATE